ncbi:MAG: hypothetical protein Q9204_007818 [Flavoplaca sp. TL-2023a]
MASLTMSPLTPETAVLADVTAQLIPQVEDTPGQEDRVAKAVLSSPDHIGLPEEEISDVLNYPTIIHLMNIPDALEDVYATTAAFAGFAFGLCSNHTDPYACEREETHCPLQSLLHLDFALESLSGTIKGLKSARDGLRTRPFMTTI